MCSFGIDKHFVSDQFLIGLQGERRGQETLIVLCYISSSLDIFADRTVYSYDNVFFIDFDLKLTHNLLCVPPLS